MKRAAVLGALLIAVALYSQSGVPVPVSQPQTGVVPADTGAALSALVHAIRSALGARGVRGTVTGVKVISLATGRELYAQNAAMPLTPASTMKLFTSATALGIFGPSYRVPTEILADSIARDAVIGDLYIRGHGDPTFTVNDLDSLVDALKARGIRRVTGDVIGDASYFDDVVDRATYSGDGEKVEDLPPVSAMVINRNRITVVAHAGARGERVRVQTVPHVPSIALSSIAISVAPRAKRAAPGRGRKRHRAMIESTPHIVTASYIVPARLRIRARKNRGRVRAGSGLRFAVYAGKNGKQSVAVSGSMSVGGTASRVVELNNPALAAASMLRNRLQTNGIAVAGEARADVAPEHAVRIVATLTPLTDILALLNKHSDNYAAEQVFKMIGAAECSCQPHASRLADSSVKYIKNWLTMCKINPAKCEMHDGSGLSHHTTITADVKVALLRTIHSIDSLFPAFYKTMAIGGVDGTIRGRMRGTLAAGNVRAKTGTLNGVTALAGYVTTRDGEMLAFDITMNSARVHNGRHVQDKIAAALASFSYAKPYLSEHAQGAGEIPDTPGPDTESEDN